MKYNRTTFLFRAALVLLVMLDHTLYASPWYEHAYAVKWVVFALILLWFVHAALCQLYWLIWKRSAPSGRVHMETRHPRIHALFSLRFQTETMTGSMWALAVAVLCVPLALLCFYPR